MEHRCFRKIKKNKQWIDDFKYEISSKVEYHIQRKTRWWPFWKTSVVFKEIDMALGALKRARKNGHSEVFELGD